MNKKLSKDYYFFLTRVIQKFCNTSGHACCTTIQAIQALESTYYVPIGCIVIIGALTHCTFLHPVCDLKDTDKYVVSKVGDHSRGQPEGFLFNSYYTDVLGRVLLLSVDCSTLLVIRTLYC